MTSEEKNTLIWNIFKLVIWAILLTSCFFYLKNHPAEQIALYSWMKNIVQKVEVFWYNVVWKNGDLLARKYELEDKYLEMIHFAEEKGCINHDFVSELYSSYETLLKEDKDEIEKYISTYSIRAADFEMSIYNNCWED